MARSSHTTRRQGKVTMHPALFFLLSTLTSGISGDDAPTRVRLAPATRNPNHGPGKLPTCAEAGSPGAGTCWRRGVGCTGRATGDSVLPGTDKGHACKTRGWRRRQNTHVTRACRAAPIGTVWPGPAEMLDHGGCWQLIPVFLELPILLLGLP